MTQEPGPSVSNGACCSSVPGWISSGVVGLVLGAGAALLGMQAFGPLPNPNVASPSAAPAAMGGGGGGGGAPGMGMGGGGMMGSGGGGGKRALAALVGKLELLSRPDLKLHVELDADQANAIAAKLVELDKIEAMTGEEAQEQLDALEALLTSDQKEVLALIGLPFGRGAGGGGNGARSVPGGASTGGGAPPAAVPPPLGMMGMGGGNNPNENPFTQEVNQKRLKDLLARLAPAAASDIVAKPE